MSGKNDPVALTRRALDHCNAGTTDQAPSIRSIPVSAYVDPERYRKERAAIFLRNPLAVALSIELPGPGSYWSGDVMGKPILLTRSKDGAVRAFLNICPHRGAVVCPEGTGKRRLFTCPYHAWSFDAHGQLVALTDEDTFGQTDKSKLGLKALACEEAAGFIWICVTPGIPIDVDRWLGEMREVLERLEIHKHHIFERSVFPGPLWKIATDGFLEVYHHNSVHSTTVGQLTIGNLLVHDTFGPHQRMVIARRNLSELNAIPQETWDEATYHKYTRCNHVIFPNLWVAKMPDGFTNVVQFYPSETPDFVVTRFTTLCAKKPDTEKEIAAARTFTDMTLHAFRGEDLPMANSIQKSVTAAYETPGAFDSLLIGRNEPAVQHYHDMVSQLSGMHNLDRSRARSE